MFTYDYTVTENDYLTFNRYTLEHIPEGKRSVWIFRGTFAVIALLLVVIFWLSGVEWFLTLTVTIALAIATVVYGLCAKRQIMKVVEKQMRRAEKKGTPLYSKAGIITFNDDAMQDNDGRMDVRIPYQSLHAVHTTPQALYFFVAPTSAILLPTHCVGGPAAVKDLMEFLQTVVPTDKIVRN